MFAMLDEQIECAAQDLGAVSGGGGCPVILRGDRSVERRRGISVCGIGDFDEWLTGGRIDHRERVP